MISVAMATYNGEKYIQEQLISIVNQTVLPDEIIVRDDISSDNTYEIIEEFANKYNGIRWDIKRNDTNLGFVKNFIGALGACNEEIIILCDQDDLWRADKVEKTIDFFSDPRVMSLHNDIDIIDEKGDLVKKSVLGYKLQKEKVSAESFVKNIYYCGMSSAFRSVLLPEMLSIDENRIPIHDWLVHALAVCKDGFYKSSDVLAYRRYHGDNVALNFSKGTREGINQRIEVVSYYCWHYDILNEINKRFGTNPKSIAFTEKVMLVNQHRLEYLRKQSLVKALSRVIDTKYYPTRKAFISDLLYLVHVF